MTDDNAPQFTDEQLEFLATIFDAARQGNTGLLRQVLDAGFTPNITNSNGDTLLILASYHCHPDAVAALLEAGADTERVNDRGQTALGCAVFRRDAGIAQQLLDAGADPDGGARSAASIAEYFQLEDMQALLAGRAIE